MQEYDESHFEEVLKDKRKREEEEALMALEVDDDIHVIKVTNQPPFLRCTRYSFAASLFLNNKHLSIRFLPPGSI